MSQPAPDQFQMSAARKDEESGGRISRLRLRYQTGPAYLSIQRARYYTESWRATEGQGLSGGERVALAMKNVYEKMDHYLDPDDRIAGYWTEYFLGMPLELERGVFNTVLMTELSKSALVRFRVRTLGRGLYHMWRQGTVSEFLRNQRLTRRQGAPPLDMGLATMAERKINPYQIREEDRRILLRELLPFWKDRSLVDELEREVAAAGLRSPAMEALVRALPGNTSRQVIILSAAATISSYQGHVILDYEPVLRQGLLRKREEVRELMNTAGLSPGERAFLNSVETALTGVIIFSQRLADRLEAEAERCEAGRRQEELKKMLAVCRRVPLLPAETFREAVQALWTVKTAVELAHPVNLHCFGRLDQILAPYYLADLAAGRVDEEEALELLSELLLKIMSQNIRPESNVLANFYHRFLGSSPVTLGGVTPSGEDAANPLTYLFLEAAARSRAITNVSVRLHPGSPPQLLDHLGRLLPQGASSFSLFNDAVMIKAMEKRGFSREDARDYAIMGCVEATCPGKTGSMSANALLLCRLLDLTLRNGDANTLAGIQRGEGPKTGDPDSFRSFDQLLAAFSAQARAAMEKIVRGSNLRDRLFAERLPAPLISAFMQGCLEKRADVTRGGAKYDLSGISMINSVGNLTDSLLAIKKLVFEEKRLTIRELLAAVDADFEGYEDLLREIRTRAKKWGNGDPEADALARRVTGELFGQTYKYQSFKGGPFVVYLISMTTHTIDGRLSLAGPDGRRAATPYAASANPANVERQGVTAVLRSVAGLGFEDVMGCAVNVKFHPTALGSRPETRAKWAALIRTYFQLGGAQLQPTVVSSETLREAQQHPENHRDLIVKVGGYSTYFVDLGREIQNEVIARTEHASCP